MGVFVGDVGKDTHVPDAYPVPAPVCPVCPECVTYRHTFTFTQARVPGTGMSRVGRGERSTPGLRLFLRLLSRSRFSCGFVSLGLGGWL